MLVARLFVLGTPPDHSTLKVDVPLPELADGPDPVPGLVREHERDVEAPADLPRNPDKRLALFLGQHHPRGVLLIGLPEALERSRRPSSSLDRAAQLRTASRNVRSHSIVRLPTGLPETPTLPARRSRMNRSQSRWDRVSDLRSLLKKRRNIAVATRSRRCVRSPFVGVTSSP